MGKEEEASVAVKATLDKLVYSVYQVKIEIDEMRPDTSCSPRKIKQCYLSLCHLQKMSSICISNVLITNATSGKKVLDHHPHLPHSAENRWTDIDGSLAVQQGLLKPAQDSSLEFVFCSWKSLNRPQIIAFV